MSDLLYAVEALTKPQTSAVIQTNDAGITCKTRSVLPSLLDQLEAAIRSSMGGEVTSGASLAFEGSPLNIAALYEAVKITSQIGDWCRGAGLVATRDPVHDLKAWHVATLARVGWDDSANVKQLQKWAHTIESLLDPPREKSLPDSCPVCGAGEWWRDGERFTRPLVIRYRTADPAGKATALCRACAQVWNARELAYAIEQAELRHAETNDEMEGKGAA
jgi:hypothetical protein